MATTTALSRRSPAPPRGGGGGLGSSLRRLRRTLMIAALVALVPTLIAYATAMTGPSNTALGVRSVEWLRDNGAAAIVGQIETWYYSLTAPPKGGHITALPKVGLPTVKHGGGSGVRTPRVRVPYIRPANVAPLIHPALPGEGVWAPTRAGLGVRPPLLVTTIRDERAYPQVVAGLAWIDTHRTQISLYAGRLEPSVTNLPNRAMEVPPSKRYRLLATFNAGFKLVDAGGALGIGGYAIGGHTYAPLKNGLATFVGYRNGTVDIVDWSHGARAPHSVLYARQNLPLIVDHGRLNPTLSTGAAWGATVGNAILVWRSGIGIDRHGNLIYAAGNYQTVMSIANVLRHAGAVRAMELDINSYWVSFITYSAWGGLNPHNLLPDMVRSQYRYLTPDDRDFFAVYLRPKYLHGG